MGLEGVELVMDIEDAFALRIPDADAVALRSPHQLLSYLRTRIPTRPAPCVSAKLFRALRAVYLRTKPIGAASFRLDSCVSQLWSSRAWRSELEHLCVAAGAPPNPTPRPASPDRVRDLVVSLAAMEIGANAPGRQVWTSEQMCLRLRFVVADCLGLPLGFPLRSGWAQLGLD